MRRIRGSHPVFVESLQPSNDAHDGCRHLVGRPRRPPRRAFAILYIMWIFTCLAHFRRVRGAPSGVASSFSYSSREVDDRTRYSYAPDDDEKGDRDCDDFGAWDPTSGEGRPPCRDDDEYFGGGGGGGGGGGFGGGGGGGGGGGFGGGNGGGGSNGGNGDGGGGNGGGNDGIDNNTEGNRPDPPPTPEGMADGAPTGPPSGVAKSNQVTVTVYVSMQDGRRSHAHLVARVLTKYWNSTQGGSDFVMHDPREYPPMFYQQQQQQGGGGGGGGRRLDEAISVEAEDEAEDSSGEVSDSSSGSGAFGNATGNRTWWDMYFVAITPDQLMAETGANQNDVWWWSYAIRYSCFWGNSVHPIKNATILSGVTDDLTSTLATGEESGDFYEWLAVHYPWVVGKSFNITTTEPLYLNETDDYFSKPLDPSKWDWRRYAGLGVFCGTVLVTAVVMQLAAYRHRRLYKRECWSNVNLGNEKGVDEILQMGWKLKGGHMEIYDKAHLGYSDDNSLFLGGYEQKEPGALCEITVTHPTEEASETNTRVDL